MRMLRATTISNRSYLRDRGRDGDDAVAERVSVGVPDAERIGTEGVMGAERRYPQAAAYRCRAVDARWQVAVDMRRQAAAVPQHGQGRGGYLELGFLWLAKDAGTEDGGTGQVQRGDRVQELPVGQRPPGQPVVAEVHGLGQEA